MHGHGRAIIRKRVSNLYRYENNHLDLEAYDQVMGLTVIIHSLYNLFGILDMMEGLECMATDSGKVHSTSFG